MARQKRGQSNVSMEEFAEVHDHIPSTVNDHSRVNDGLRLHTTDGDPESDIITYDDDRSAHRVGNPPE